MLCVPLMRSGAVMAVPAHDTRDFEFAQKFGITPLQVVPRVIATSEEVDVERTRDMLACDGTGCWHQILLQTHQSDLVAHGVTLCKF